MAEHPGTDLKPIPLNMVQIGKSGTEVQSGIYTEEYLTQLQGHQASQIYNKMRRSDPQVRKVIAAITNPIKSAKWFIEPVSDDSIDLEVASLIEQIIFRDIKWNKKLHEILTFIPLGHSVFEVVHMNREHPELGQYTGLRDLAFRKQATLIEWRHNRDTGELEKIKQESYSDIIVNVWLPSENLLIFMNEAEGDDNGFPMLRPLFGPYKRKLLATELQYIGIERFAIPTPLIKVPSKIKTGSKEYITAIDTITNFVSAEEAYIAYPEGWEVNLAQNNTFDPEKVEKVKKAEDEQMAGAILATFLELGIGGNSGAFALGNDLSDFFLAGLEHFATELEEPFNTRLIPHLVKLNFGDRVKSFPKLNHSGISDKAGKELMEIVTGYINAGAIGPDEILEDHLRNVHSLPKKAEGKAIDNMEAEDGPGPGNGGDGSRSNEPIDNGNDDPDLDDDQRDVSLKLQDSVPDSLKREGDGNKHIHIDSQGRETGPRYTISEGLHSHLDADGRQIGIASDDDLHTHTDSGGETSSPTQDLSEHRKKDKEKDKKYEMSSSVKLQEKKPKTPRQLIERDIDKNAKVLREGMRPILDKYIRDVMNKWEKLSDSQKGRAIEGVKIGGQAKLRQALRVSYIQTATDALEMVRSEVPSKSDVKLKDWDEESLAKLSEGKKYKLNDFSKLPKHVQIILNQRAELDSDRQSRDGTELVAFQFTSSLSSTNDPNVLRQDMVGVANDFIEGGKIDLAAANTTSFLINESRNSFLFDDEVQEDVVSYTYVNPSPVAQICKELAGRTFPVTNSEFRRFQPPNHHNCKSYISANLKTLKNPPEITDPEGVAVSRSALDSITLGEK